MEIEEKLIDLLDSGDLDGVADLIAQHPELKKDRELYERIQMAIQQRGEAELREEIDGYLKDYLENQKDQKRPVITRYFFYGSVAASLALILFFVYRPKDNLNPDAPINFEINSMPVHADSATLQADSLQNNLDSLKESEK